LLKRWRTSVAPLSTLNAEMNIPGFKHLVQARNFVLRGRQSGWAMAEYFAYPLMMFIATPIFLHLLGTAQYGQWMLLLTFNGLGGLAGLGMGTAAIKEVSAHRGRGDLAGGADAVRSCLGVTLVSSFALSAIIFILGIFTGPALLAKMGEPVVVRNIIIAAAFLIALEQVDTVFAGAIRGMERFDISARVEATAKLAMVLAALLAALATHRLEPVIWTTVTVTALRAMVKAIIATRVLSQGALLPRWDQSHVKRVFAFGKWTWAQSIGAAMFATADRMIVGSVLGADALARYSVCLQLAQQIQTVPAAGAQVLFPMISRLMERGDGVQPFVLKAMFWSALFSTVLATLIILFSHIILSLWVGSEIANQSSSVLMVLAVSFALLAINNVPHFVLLGLNDARSVAWVNIAAGLLAVAISVVLIPKVDLIGAAIGRLAYASVICLLIALMIRRLGHPIHRDRMQARQEY
jgi:O-antigen/teichoic acid export membrane protein